jgi:hypothetical protein
MSTRRLGLVFAVVLAAGMPAHAHEGPHGGALYEGAKHKYHAELKVNEKDKAVTVYILDDKAKKAVPIKAKTIEMRIKGVSEPIVLNAVPSKDDPGTSSQFVGKNDRFGTKLKFDELEFSIKVDGKEAHKFTYED